MSEYRSSAAIRRSELRNVLLHDCRVTRINLRGDFAELEIPKGVWLRPDTPDNPGETLCKTRAATVRIPAAALPRALAVRSLNGSGALSPLAWRRLVRHVNAEGWALEFLDQHPRGTFIRLDGWLWRDSWTPVHEWAFTLPADAVEILWSEINPKISW